ncbi:MAG: hypothetical protein R3B37_16495 [Nitrospira sp.]|nr:hypothetical protein [Nitrospira sp.]
MEKTLNRLSIFQVRCQLFTTRFQARRPGSRQTSQEFDRREYRRLRANFAASLVLDQPAVGRVTAIFDGWVYIASNHFAATRHAS